MDSPLIFALGPQEKLFSQTFLIEELFFSRGANSVFKSYTIGTLNQRSCTNILQTNSNPTLRSTVSGMMISHPTLVIYVGRAVRHC
jgi:hypothetical protein